MPPAHLYPRTDLAGRYLGRLLDRPERALSLFGPRQIGKTTFLAGDLAQAARGAGLRPIYIDLMATQQPLEALNGALRDELHTLKMRPLQQRVKALKLLSVGVDVEAQPAAPSSADAGQQLQHALAELLRQPGVPRVLLMLDEVQELARAPGGGAQALRALRAAMNQHKVSGRLLVLMTGSSQAGMARLFASHAQPSFGLADREDFPLLGREYVGFVVQRANQARARAHKLDVEVFIEAFIGPLGSRPADLEAFIGYISTYGIADVAGALGVFLAQRYPPDEIEQRFKAFTPLQQALLRALAGGARQFTGRPMLERLAVTLGAPVSAPAVRKALLSLPAHTVSNPGRGEYSIEDPLLLAWLRQPSAAPADMTAPSSLRSRPPRGAQPPWERPGGA